MRTDLRWRGLTIVGRLREWLAGDHMGRQNRAGAAALNADDRECWPFRVLALRSVVQHLSLSVSGPFALHLRLSEQTFARGDRANSRRGIGPKRNRVRQQLPRPQRAVVESKAAVPYAKSSPTLASLSNGCGDLGVATLVGPLCNRFPLLVTAAPFQGRMLADLPRRILDTSQGFDEASRLPMRIRHRARIADARCRRIAPESAAIPPYYQSTVRAAYEEW